MCHCMHRKQYVSSHVNALCIIYTLCACLRRLHHVPGQDALALGVIFAATDSVAVLQVIPPSSVHLRPCPGGHPCEFAPLCELLGCGNCLSLRRHCAFRLLWHALVCSYHHISSCPCDLCLPVGRRCCAPTAPRCCTAWSSARASSTTPLPWPCCAPCRRAHAMAAVLAHRLIGPR